MIISETTEAVKLAQLREVESALSDADKALITVMWAAAIQYIKAETGIECITEDEAEDVGTDQYLDRYEDLTVAALCLLSDMYDNRQTTVDKSNANRTVNTILKRYQFNLIAGEDEE